MEGNDKFPCKPSVTNTQTSQKFLSTLKKQKFESVTETATCVAVLKIVSLNTVA